MTAAVLTLMELAWSYPWLVLFGLVLTRQPEPLLPLWSALLLLGGGQGVPRWLQRLGWPLPRVRIVAVALGLAAALGLAWLARGAPEPDLTPATFALVAALHLWRRGLLHSQSPANREALGHALAVGTIALALVVVLGSAASAPEQRQALREGALLPVLAFYALGLTGLAAARLDEVRRRDAALPADRGWLGLVLATVLGLLGVALLAGALLSFDLAAALLRSVVWAISLVLWVFILVLAVPTALVLEWLVGWVQHHLPPMSREPFDLRGALGLDRLPSREIGDPPPDLLAAAQYVAVAMAVALAVFLLARAVLWRRGASSDPEVPEERDSVWSWALLREAVADWLASLRARFRRAVPPPFSVAAANETIAATTIRALYRELLARAAAAGAPRRPDATPREHLPRVEAALGPDPGLADLTDAYVRARYGDRAPEEAEVEALRAWWRRRGVSS